jgi:hypothetical protein
MSSNNTSNQEESILTKEYRWSLYPFLINIGSFTLLNIVILLLMLMHRATDPNVRIATWVLILVPILLELFFVGISYLDVQRKNPKAKMFDASIFNLPVLALLTIIAIAIFWGSDVQNAIVYGVITGGFAGYLAGGLAYANFFIKIQDSIYRTIFGGWIGTALGAVFGGLFSYLVEPTIGQVFGGVFWGFWGGAIVSGPIATVLLYLLKEHEHFTQFFSYLMLFSIRKEMTQDLKKYMESHKNIKTEEIKVLQTIPQTPKSEWNIFVKIVYFISPWEIRNEQKRMETYQEILDYACKKLGYTKEEGKISRE